MTITIGSLFSGIGGLEYGLEAGLAAAGVPTRTLWQVEQDDYARAVLARHWPNAERYTDVRDITASSVAPADLICGGFPCQDISTAGKGAGLAGERSGLFFEMARIVRELRPRVVVLENVPAITTRGLDVVLGTLAALGYDARWGGLRASEVGAPHRRERWFCVGWRAEGDAMGDANKARQQTGRRVEHLRSMPAPRSAASLADDDRQRSKAGARLPARSAGSGLPDPDRGNRSGTGMADARQRGLQLCGDPGELRRTSSQAQAGEAGQRQRQREGAGCGSAALMADSISDRLQGQQQARPATRAVHRADRAGEWRQAESGVGGDADGLSCRLDLHRWPAPPGPQYAHEPPRTRPRQPHDRARLRALGNAVVPQCAAVVGRWIADELLEVNR